MNDNIWQVVWPVVEQTLTPPLVGALLITIAATHAVKILAEHWHSEVTETAARWRAFCTSVSLAIGAVAGACAWLLTDATWVVIPIVAFGAGPIWRAATAFVPWTRLTTATDRKYRAKK